MPLRLVLLSDTPGLHRQIGIPDGDVPIHTGDFSSEGEAVEARSFAEFFRSLPHRHKVVIAGNHDRCLEANPGLGSDIFAGCHYLLDGGVEIGGVTFRGSPWQPWFFDMAFNLERGAQLREKWVLIPARVEVLITHGPPQYVLDWGETGENVGCEELRDATERTSPRLNVFGHICQDHGWRHFGRTLHVNASNCAVHQEPLNSASVVDLPADGDTAVATKVP